MSFFLSSCLFFYDFLLALDTTSPLLLFNSLTHLTCFDIYLFNLTDYGRWPRKTSPNLA